MLTLLGDEWSLLIVQQAMLGATRYGEFLARLPISNAMLTGRLRTLTDGLLFERVAYQTNPVRTEYLLTPMGRSLWPMMVSIWEWERHWVPEHTDRLPSMHHTTCGSDFTPVVVCGACAGAAGEKDVRVRWGPSGTWPRSVPTSVNRRRPDSDSRPGMFPETMSVFGNRWSAAILIAAFLGARRFGDFQNQLGAPPGSISERLRTFCANGVLVGAVDYRLTEKGRALFPVLVTALDWGQRWFGSEEGDAVVLTHRSCGQLFSAVLACDRCAQTLAGGQIVAG
jgi:DNA-binding HxlR family transcriptional regulator